MPLSEKSEKQISIFTAILLSIKKKDTACIIHISWQIKHVNI